MPVPKLRVSRHFPVLQQGQARAALQVECSVTGDIPSLVEHLKDDHKVDMHSGCTFNHR